MAPLFAAARRRWLVVPTLECGLAAALILAGCRSESEPKTWVKDLAVPERRTGAMETLETAFAKRLEASHGDLRAPGVRGLIDFATEPVAKQVVDGGFAPSAKIDAIKFLAASRDPRSAAALSKVLDDFHQGSTSDDELRLALPGVVAIASEGNASDALLAALWSCFSRYRVSQATAASTVAPALRDAILSVKSSAYASKAVDLIARPVDATKPEMIVDEVQFWQRTALDLLAELRYGGAAKPVVRVLLSPSKADLRAPAAAALREIPLDAERALLGAFNRTDADLARLASAFPKDGDLAILADALAEVSRAAGRDAVMARVASVTSPVQRALLAATLPRFPRDPRSVAAFLDAYAKVPANTQLPELGGEHGRPRLAAAAAGFLDATMVDWLLGEVLKASGPEQDALRNRALSSAIDLMTVENAKRVSALVSRFGGAVSVRRLSRATKILERCNADAGCFVSAIAGSVVDGGAGATEDIRKAAAMAAMFGNAATSRELVKSLAKITDREARRAICDAIEFLLPGGDRDLGLSLRKMADGEAAGRGDAYRNVEGDPVRRLAGRLIARASQS